MNIIHRASLASYITGLLASGRITFSPEDVQAALGISQGAFLDAAEKLQKRGQVIAPRRGFYVAVPPQYLNLGSPPPSFFIDDLMRHEGAPYYVGLLKAAELHGASHQAAMEFQVVTTKQVPLVTAGRTRLAFYYRKSLEAVAGGIGQRNTDTGTMKVSSPELTILDLFRYPQANGGLDNVATVLDGLGHKAYAKKLAALAPAFERPVLQRAGYLLGKANLDELADTLLNSLCEGPPLRWIELDRSLASDSDLAPAISERDKRWRVVVRHVPEHDA